MEEASRRGILGRHQSFDSERIDILSDSIECNHSSRNTSSFFYSKSCQTEDWRSLVRESIHVTSTCTKDLTEARNGLRNWVRKLFNNQKGKLFENQKEKLLDNAKFFQPTQPTPNPIRDRSGRPDNMQDGRNTSRSQEINVNSFNEELSSSDSTGRPVETEVIQTRSSEDTKSLNVEQTHDRTGRPVATLHTAEAQDSSRVCSAHESETFNVEDEVLRKIMEKSVADHESMMVNEADMDFRIPGLPHSVVKHAQSTSVR